MMIRWMVDAEEAEFYISRVEEEKMMMNKDRVDQKHKIDGKSFQPLQSLLSKLKN